MVVGNRSVVSEQISIEKKQSDQVGKLMSIVHEVNAADIHVHAAEQVNIRVNV